MNAGVFLLLGTNMGDRNKNLAGALSAIERAVGSIKKRSSVYQTAAWGKTDQPSFYNQVIAIETLLSPQELLEAILVIERVMGRMRNEKWGERIIDIDILLYGDIVVETERLIIPHPQLANRRFTLVPLNEIAAEVVHPLLQKKVRVLLAECGDELGVDKIVGAL